MASMGYEREPVALTSTEGAVRCVGAADERARMVGWMTKAHFRTHRGVRVPQFRLRSWQGGLRW